MASMHSMLSQYLLDLSSFSIPHYIFILTLTLILFYIFILPHTNTAKTRASNPNLGLPPSPKPLPLLGHLLHLGSLPHRSLQKLSSIYGPIMYLRLGSVPAVVLSSAPVVEKLVRHHDAALGSRPHMAVADILMYGSCDIGFSPYGEYWRQARRICVLHLLSNKRVQSFGVVREQEVALLIDKIFSVYSSHGGSGSVVNLSRLLVKLTNDIVCRAVLGRKFPADGSDKAPGLLNQLVAHLGTTLVGEYVPCLGWLDWLTGKKKRMRKTAEGLDSLLESTIEEHVKARRDALRDGKYGEGMEGSDLVDVLLNIQENEEEIGVSLSRNNIKAIILDMFSAGTDTVFTAIEWTMAELIRNPKEMKKVQDEVRDVISATGRLTDELIEKMTYLNAAVKEAFRLHPPSPLLVPRESTEDITVMGYHVPAGTRLIFNAWAIGRDPNSWETAGEFVPERFLGSNVDYKGQHFELIPFGTGRRSCPGISFATTTIGFTLASLLYHFNWNLPDEIKRKPLDMSELKGMAVHKKRMDLILETKLHCI